VLDRHHKLITRISKYLSLHQDLCQEECMLHALAYPGGIRRLSTPEREPGFMPMKAMSHVTIGSRSVCPDAAQCRKRTFCSSVVCSLALLRER
jgi:hypothetical protein